MTRFYLKDGQEVKVGSTIRVESKTKTPFGEGITSVDVVITEDIIPILVEKDIITAKDDEDATIKSYVRRVARTHSMDYPEVSAFLGIMLHHDEFLVLYLLLKAASEKAMCEYKGDTCCVIHMHTGRLISIKNEDIPSHVLVFPSVEKAKEAINVLRGLFREVYGNKQED